MALKGDLCMLAVHVEQLASPNIYPSPHSPSSMFIVLQLCCMETLWIGSTWS